MVAVDRDVHDVVGLILLVPEPCIRGVEVLEGAAATRGRHVDDAAVLVGYDLFAADGKGALVGMRVPNHQ